MSPRAAIFGVALLQTLVTITSSQHWNDPNSDQFHIQTDEGNERYFRYQTHNGQYRKEKRLEDGTIVGSYGWIDEDGMLRLQDYIADNAGYRILRTKDVFVGRNRPISQAIKVAKKAPSTGGILTKTSHLYPPNGYVASTTESPLNNEISSVGYISSTESPLRISSTGIPPSYSSTSLPISYSSTPRPPVVSSTPANYFNIPSSTPYVAVSSTPASIYPPAVYLPSSSPTADYLPASPIPATVYISPKTYSASSTPSPLYIPSATTPSYYYDSSTPSSVYLSEPSSTVSPSAVAINGNYLDYNSEPQYDHQSQSDYRFQNGPTYPITKFGASYTGNHIGNGYDPQYPKYNGVSVTNDGFRYYIPRAYHEEQSDDRGATKSGSFGYIDPFGIRRVVYYNAGPGGFKHRKNNRYVGFNATPYDPRPY